MSEDFAKLIEERRAFNATPAGQALKKLHDAVGADAMHTPVAQVAVQELIAEINRLQTYEEADKARRAMDEMQGDKQ